MRCYMTTRFLDNLRPFCVFVAALAIAGCSSESDKKPPPDANTNRNVLTPSGTPVGHLKPRRMSKARHDPVVWVVAGNAVERRSDEVLIHAFRLDFDETQPITEADLPYALMTDNSKEIVVHRGKPPKDFSHPDINGGEPCSPIYQCGNLDECPRVKELMNLEDEFPKLASQMCKDAVF